MKNTVSAVRIPFTWLFLLCAGVIVSACSPTTYRFRAAEPVQVFNDMKAVPLPSSAEYEKTQYMFDVLVRRPAVRGLQVNHTYPARDVNALDEVLPSSWFTPRLGYQELSPGELLQGPTQVGPPQPPITVVKAKSGGGNPGFIIADKRGERYLIKFDPPEFPGLETTTALLVNRMFWGFGYNVPEDFLYTFRDSDLQVDAGGDLTTEDVQRVLKLAAAPQDGYYRSTASLFIPGKILGPVPDKGVREDDANDHFPHEDRRILRALRVFSAFVNHSDIRIDNSLDVYVGEPGQGYVKHYLLDFGEAFGGHGAEHDFLWDGFKHRFSYSDFFGNLFTAGLRVEDWENLQYSQWKSVGAFEAEVFDPQSWKEVFPYEPIRRSRAEDDYWAAKILGALSEAHLRVLVEAARYPEPAAGKYILQTLLKRREKVLEAFLQEVSPLDFSRLTTDELVLLDLRRELLGSRYSDSRYEVDLLDANGKNLAPRQQIPADAGFCRIPLSEDLFAAGNGYLQVHVRVWHAGKRAPRPAQFHLSGNSAATARLIGVVH